MIHAGLKKKQQSQNSLELNFTGLHTHSPPPRLGFYCPKCLKEKWKFFTMKSRHLLNLEKLYCQKLLIILFALHKNILQSYCLLPFEPVKSLTALNRIPMPLSSRIVQHQWVAFGPHVKMDSDHQSTNSYSPFDSLFICTHMYQSVT